MKRIVWNQCRNPQCRRDTLAVKETRRIWRRVVSGCGTVCDRWLVFALFLSDMGPRPSMFHSAYRIDSNGVFEPGNCCWATKREAARPKLDATAERDAARGRGEHHAFIDDSGRFDWDAWRKHGSPETTH